VRHGFFEIDVFLSVEGGLEAGIVLVVGGGDHDSVDAVLAEQVVVIEILFGARSTLRGLFEVGLIDVTHRYALSAELLKILA